MVPKTGLYDYIVWNYAVSILFRADDEGVPQILETLASIATPVRFSKRDIISVQGQIAGHLLFIDRAGKG